MNKLLVSSAIIVLFFAVALSGCFNETDSSDGSDTKRVVIEGKGTYSSIQAAIDNASVGDTIFVSNGTYYETLVINTTTTLIGASNEKTIVDSKKSVNYFADTVLVNADNCTITGFKITNTNTSPNDAVGIKIKSSNNTISNTTVVNLDDGIYIDNDANHNTLVWNTISQNEYGITSRFSYKNTISYNNISSNSLYGMYLYSQSNNIVISENIIADNGQGLRVKGSANNKIFGNTVIDNLEGMLFCCGANNNMIYYNVFKNNSEWHAQDLLNNHWDNGSVGNYWDDYTGIDVDGDGIGDAPYDIPNGDNGGVQDRYPLMNPIEL